MKTYLLGLLSAMLGGVVVGALLVNSRATSAMASLHRSEDSYEDLWLLYEARNLKVHLLDRAYFRDHHAAFRSPPAAYGTRSLSPVERHARVAQLAATPPNAAPSPPTMKP
jgi:hypothetical protein